MKKLVLIIFIAFAFVWYGFHGEATTRIEVSTDIPATNFTGAKLGGVSLDGFILCKTTMPVGAINNSSCKN